MEQFTPLGNTVRMVYLAEIVVLKFEPQDTCRFPGHTTIHIPSS